MRVFTCSAQAESIRQLLKIIIFIPVLTIKLKRWIIFIPILIINLKRWMVGDEERGEGAEEELRSNNLISSWAYTAKKSDSKVECVAVYQKGEIEKKASISFKVKEEQVVTLRNIEAKKSAPVKENLAVMEEESETKVEVQKTDFEVIDEDAVDRIAGFGAAPQEQFFEAGKDS